jgi:cation diffusion facilitator family transporter
MLPGSADLSRAGWRVTVIGILVNATLIVAKTVAGVLGHSHALIADAIHSISDFVTDGVVLFGIKAGRRAPDTSHHFGHGRIETLASTMIGASLVGVAVYLTIESIERIRLGVDTQPTGLAVAGAAISIVAKELLYRVTVRVGRRIKSHAVMANAWHHRSDALSSIAVLVGVGAAQIDGNLRVLDAWAALLVALLIVRVGTRIVWSSVKEFTDAAPPIEIVNSMRKVARATEGVVGIHDLKVRMMGGLYLVQIHVEVDGTLTVTQGHSIAATVEASLKAALGDITSVIVHVDPAAEQESSAGGGS